MKLVEFSIAEDFIALRRGSDYFDLHNNFDFQALAYDTAQRSLELRWVRSARESVKATEPTELRLLFAGVYLFKASERDPGIPYTEDDCLESIGFIWDDMLLEMRGFTSNQPAEGCAHLNVVFMSGFSIKVGAESAALFVAGSA